MPDTKAQYKRQIAIWLLACAAMIYIMILLGGVTRLTHSGLSIVEWKPLIGAIPPLGESDWELLFHKYQQFPEYQKINHGMSLHEFKVIFMYEYLHRLLGRLIGLVFFLPFAFFWIKKRIPPGMTRKLLFMFALGGLQGLLGWYMVMSGLVDNPRVSQYRLAAHLGTAVFIYGYICWIAFQLLESPADLQSSPAGLRYFSYLLSSLIFLMILSGGLVAGTHAGLAFNTFPLMGDRLIPYGLYGMQPAWLSAFEDVTTIQFNHRVFAYSLIVLISAFYTRTIVHQLNRTTRIGMHLLLLFLVVQVGLGITTLLLRVPVALAVAHQAGAVALFTTSLFISHKLRRR